MTASHTTILAIRRSLCQGGRSSADKDAKSRWQMRQSPGSLEPADTAHQRDWPEIVWDMGCDSRMTGEPPGTDQDLAIVLGPSMKRLFPVKSIARVTLSL